MALEAAEPAEESIGRSGNAHVSMDPPTIEAFLKAAISLKDQVVEATWKACVGRCADPTAYGGLLGTAIVCLRSYEAIGCPEDLRLCGEIVDTCTAVAQSYKRSIELI